MDKDNSRSLSLRRTPCPQFLFHRDTQPYRSLDYGVAITDQDFPPRGGHVGGSRVAGEESLFLLLVESLDGLGGPLGTDVCQQGSSPTRKEHSGAPECISTPPQLGHCH
ncbi:hypothetical protein BaRGS_00029550 [Batillaria attramentaria]|uniref:Uncharacterized protein n=1 Tax=Batillaria attramentaria TaxID=370345 RepID=A0ABD0JWX5_9CAEN